MPLPRIPRPTAAHVRKAAPDVLLAAEAFVLVAPLVAPVLAPVHAARLLTAARCTALTLTLVRR